MRLSYKQLPAALQQSLQPLYFFFGNETLLLEEGLNQLRKTASEQGFSQRERYTQETGFDWNVLLDTSQTMSLFVEKRIIELRLPTGKPGDAGGKFLLQNAERLAQTDSGFENIFVIISADIDKRSQNTKWFKALEQHAVIAQFPELSERELPQWIHQRLAAKNVQADQSVSTHLATYVEGNLLAAAQEINLLGLLYENQSLTIDQLEQVIADHARFDIYQLADALLAGQHSRVIRILETLQRDHAEPVLILWALTRDVRILCQLSALTARGQSARSHYRNYGVWQSRAALFDKALQRLQERHWQQILYRISKLDLMIKGQAPLQRQSVWEEIESLALLICGGQIVC